MKSRRLYSSPLTRLPSPPRGRAGNQATCNQSDRHGDPLVQRPSSQLLTPHHPEGQRAAGLACGRSRHPDNRSHSNEHQVPKHCDPKNRPTYRTPPALQRFLRARHHAWSFNGSIYCIYCVLPWSFPGRAVILFYR